MTNAEQDIKIERIDQKVDSFKETVENFIQEMRDRDNKRDADIRELRQRHDADMKAIEENRAADHEKYEADMKELRSEIRDGIRHIQGLTIAAIVGIVAIAVAIIAFVFVTWQDQRIYYQQAIQSQNFSQSQNYSPSQNQTQ